MERIEVKFGEKSVSLPPFSTVGTALVELGVIEKNQNYDYQTNPVVGALVNGEASPLGRRLMCSSSIEPVHVFDSLGRRIYRHSICFLLSLSSYLCFPERTLVIGHSLGDGYYFSFSDDGAVTDDDAAVIEKKMRELVAKRMDIEYTATNGEDAEKVFLSLGRRDTALLLSSRNDPYIYMYRLDGYAQVSYEPLVENTAVLSVFELRKYSDRGLLLRYPTSSSIKEIANLRDNPLLFSVFEEYKMWGKVLGVRSLGEMNRLNVEGGMAEYIKLSEDLHRRKIASIADAVAEKGARIVFVAGPSSSGKTTFAKRLCEQLKLLGFEPFKLSLDDYYKAPWEAPKDEKGEPDLEALEALNIELIDRNMSELVEGRSVNLPSYDFNTHITTFSPVPVRMGEKTIIVVEGIHALNRKITSCIDEKFVYRVYISALTQLNLDDSNRVSTADNRLLRRLLRDYRSRGMSAVRTLNIWPSVTRGESRHIFPNQNNADVMFNSALDYEIAVLTPFVRPLLTSVRREEGEAYSLARRLLAFLENVYPVSSVYVPSDSILREFIGQSDYE